jgi:hypothetical protein
LLLPSFKTSSSCDWWNRRWISCLTYGVALHIQVKLINCYISASIGMSFISRQFIDLYT